LPRLEKNWADGAYTGEKLATWRREQGAADVPKAAGWHHKDGENSARETQLGKEEAQVFSVIEERNKTLVRRFLEAQADNGDLDVLEELLAPDFVDHSLRPDQDSGREGYIRLDEP